MFYRNDFVKIRKNKKKSVNEICKDIGIHRSTLWEWENGKRIPKKDKVYALSKSLEVPVEKISNLPPIPKLSYKELGNVGSSLEKSLNNFGSATGKKLNAIISSLGDIEEEFSNVKVIMQAIYSSINSIFYIKDINLNYISVNDMFLDNLSLQKGYDVNEKQDSDFFYKSGSKEKY